MKYVIAFFVVALGGTIAGTIAGMARITFPDFIGGFLFGGMLTLSGFVAGAIVAG